MAELLTFQAKQAEKLLKRVIIYLTKYISLINRGKLTKAKDI